jgi:pimeloyl-ACP methyl ester carboxylesterase
VHGGPGEAHDYLRPHFDRLAEPQRSVVYYDQRGAPGSPCDETLPGWREHVSDLEAVIASGDWDEDAEVTLIGFSWGALLALLYVFESTRHIERVVAIAPPTPRLSTSPQPRRGAARGLDPADDREGGSALSAFAARVAPHLYDPSLASALHPVPLNQAVEASTWASEPQRALDTHLETLDRAGAHGERLPPTLIVVGDHDQTSAPGAPALAERLGADLVKLERCGHAPFVETPASFFRVLEAFLTAPRAHR